MAYESILVAVDLTDEADEVLEAAINLADGKVEKLTLVTVVRPIVQTYGSMDWGSLTGVDFEEKALQQTKARTLDLARRHGIAGGVTYFL